MFSEMALSVVPSDFKCIAPIASSTRLKFPQSKDPSCCLTRLNGYTDRVITVLKSPCLEKSAPMSCFRRAKHLTSCSMTPSFGNQADEPFGYNPVFPRINIRDPYKRLGISKEASEEEIQAARNFLIAQYAGHKPSVDAIESAYDKILLQSFRKTWMPKFDLKARWRAVKESELMKSIYSRFETPSAKVIFKTTAVFLLLMVLSILKPTEDGPVYQVATSFIANIYFINSRLKSKIRAFLYGCATFLFSWVLGSFLMATLLPPLVEGPRSIEASTSIVSYVFLWITSTYLK